MSERETNSLAFCWETTEKKRRGSRSVVERARRTRDRREEASARTLSHRWHTRLPRTPGPTTRRSRQQLSDTAAMTTDERWRGRRRRRRTSAPHVLTRGLEREDSRSARTRLPGEQRASQGIDDPRASMTLVECAGEVWRKSRVSWLGGGVAGTRRRDLIAAPAERASASSCLGLRARPTRSCPSSRENTCSVPPRTGATDHRTPRERQRACVR